MGSLLLLHWLSYAPRQAYGLYFKLSLVQFLLSILFFFLLFIFDSVVTMSSNCLGTHMLIHIMNDCSTISFLVKFTWICLTLRKRQRKIWKYKNMQKIYTHTHIQFHMRQFIIMFVCPLYFAPHFKYVWAHVHHFTHFVNGFMGVFASKSAPLHWKIMQKKYNNALLLLRLNSWFFFSYCCKMSLIRSFWLLPIAIRFSIQKCYWMSL